MLLRCLLLEVREKPPCQPTPTESQPKKTKLALFGEAGNHALAMRAEPRTEEILQRVANDGTEAAKQCAWGILHSLELHSPRSRHRKN